VLSDSFGELLLHHAQNATPLQSHASRTRQSIGILTHFPLFSSAKDQLMGASVAIKKIMKPFSAPVLSKRTSRELKLLKHISTKM
jgi:serine/threonine protein kinase